MKIWGIATPACALVRNDKVFSNSPIAFEQPMENGPGEEPGVTNWGAFEEDTMFSTFAVTDFTQFFDGNQVKMGGIGGVATLPSHRRKGGIRGIFQAALTDVDF